MNYDGAVLQNREDPRPGLAEFGWAWAHTSCGAVGMQWPRGGHRAAPGRSDNRYR